MSQNKTSLVYLRTGLQKNLSKRGQTLVEYALILAFIAVVAIVVLQALGTQVKSKFSQISSALENAT